MRFFLLFAAFLYATNGLEDENGEIATYEHVKEMMYYIGNDFRTEPE